MQILSTQPTQLLPHSPNAYSSHALQQQLLLDLHRRSTASSGGGNNVSVVTTGVA